MWFALFRIKGISVSHYYCREQKAMPGQMNIILKGFFVLIMTSCYLNSKFKIIQREVQY